MNLLRPVRAALVCLCSCCALATPLRAAPPASQPAQRGSVTCDWFKQLTGDQVADLLESPLYPSHPTKTEFLKAFEIEPLNEDNWGAAVRGYVYPPVSGRYTFWLASDDSGQLFLSSDEDPAHCKQIAEVSGWTAPRAWDERPTQKSKVVTLEAGKRYYVEADVKNAGGVGHVAVGWQLPDGTLERPIPGSRVAPATTHRPPAPKVPTVVTLDTKQPLATTPGHHKFKLGATVTHGETAFPMSYLLYLPKGYEKTDDRKPMFVFLCGNSHQGEDLEGILNEGPAVDLRDNAALRDWFPMVALFPQPPNGTRWDTPGMATAVVGLIDAVAKTYRIDRDRIYVSGLSMGGKGTWLVSQAAPDRFAAIAPISGVSVTPETAGQTLHDVATWVICGSDDGDFTEGSKRMYAALQAAGCRAKLTVFPHEGHGVWARFYPDPKFYQWLLQYRRPATPAP